MFLPNQGRGGKFRYEISVLDMLLNRFDFRRAGQLRGPRKGSVATNLLSTTATSIALPMSGYIEKEIPGNDKLEKGRKAKG